ncbi:MFS transporter [Zhihengliuella halotolerans]|uniref:Putative MFS family arabinose efflux permease n=1 Tax=Zhihengliuella halotolerans TaxID=370736 RepID=A0A4Q8ABK0_9MICC|nr:MFS transporter [Zhihengliuella halotolerans]RZU60909.1 putative MFS family arabinose efflux permease [Zhihengliuella halotolerans]
MTVIGELRMRASDDLSLRGGWDASLKTRVGLTGAVMALLFIGVNIATPLYPLLQDKLELGPFGVTVAFSAYVLALIAGLVCYGHWSDHIGRRAALVIAVVVGLAGGLVFAFAPSLWMLVLGRVLQGAAVAAATGASSAALRELLPRHQDWAGRFTLLLNAGGVAAGPVIGGVLSQLPNPTVTPFLVHGAAMLAVLVPLWLLRARPALAPAPGDARRALRPRRLRLAADAKSQFWIAALTGLLSFAVFGMVLSLAPGYYADVFGIESRVLLGVIASLTLAASAVSQLLGRATPATIAPALVGMGLGVAVLVLGGHVASLPLVIAGSLLAGTAQGLAFRGAFNDAAAAIEAAQHAQVISLIYVVTYAGSAIPVLGLGLVANQVGLDATFVLFAATTLAGCLVLAGVSWARLRRRGPRA